MVSWEPDRLEVVVPPGLREGVAVKASVRRGVEEPELEIEASLDGAVSGILPEGPLERGPHELSLQFHPPADAEPGDVFEGTVRLRDQQKRGLPLVGGLVRGLLGEVAEAVGVSKPLFVRVEVDELDEDAAFSQVSRPSPDRLEPTAGGLVVSDEVLVTVEAGEDEASSALAVADRHGGHIVGAVPGVGLYQLQLSSPGSLSGLIEKVEQMRKDPDVAGASVRLFSAVADVTTPSDPVWDGWDGLPDGNNWHLQEIGAPVAWDMQTDASDVTVAVLDADLSLSHEDLSFSSYSDHGHATKHDGHGTKVAGVLCADGDNGVGISGVAWRCDLHAHDVLDTHIRKDGSAMHYVDPVSEAEAWEAAVAKGARVVNMSYGSNLCWDEMSLESRARQILLAQDKAEWIRRVDPDQQVLWVQSAGNSGCDMAGQQRAFLSGQLLDTYVTVAGTNADGGLFQLGSDASNFGDDVTIAAPGAEILTTALGVDAYQSRTGTSYAAPIVSGTAALMFALEPELDARSARECLVESAEAGRQLEGHGFAELNMVAALRCARNHDGADDPPSSGTAGPGQVADAPIQVARYEGMGSFYTSVHPSEPCTAADGHYPVLRYEATRLGEDQPTGAGAMFGISEEEAESILVGTDDGDGPVEFWVWCAEVPDEIPPSEVDVPHDDEVARENATLVFDSFVIESRGEFSAPRVDPTELEAEEPITVSGQCPVADPKPGVHVSGINAHLHNAGDVDPGNVEPDGSFTQTFEVQEYALPPGDTTDVHVSCEYREELDGVTGHWGSRSDAETVAVVHSTDDD